MKGTCHGNHVGKAATTFPAPMVAPLPEPPQQITVEELLSTDYPVRVPVPHPCGDQVVRQNAVPLVDDDSSDQLPSPDPPPPRCRWDAPNRRTHWTLPIGVGSVMPVGQQPVQETVLLLDALSGPSVNGSAHSRAHSRDSYTASEPLVECSLQISFLPSGATHLRSSSPLFLACSNRSRPPFPRNSAKPSSLTK
jgi:hypothetical protein